MSPVRKEDDRLHIPRMDAQAIVTIAIGLAGVVAWMSKVAVDLGQIRGALEARIEYQDKELEKVTVRIDEHGRALTGHEQRIGVLERSK